MPANLVALKMLLVYVLWTQPLAAMLQRFPDDRFADDLIRIVRKIII